MAKPFEKYLAGIPAEGEPGPEKETRFEAAGDLRAAAFSLRGRGHERAGEPLQDSCRTAALPGGWLIAAVADGVGSEPRAEAGARIAAGAAVEFCRDFWTGGDGAEDLLQAAYHHAYGCVALQAGRERRDIHDFGTTLHAAIFTGEEVFYGHAGDGGILAMGAGGGYRSLTQPQKGEDGDTVVSLLAGPSRWEFGRSGDALSVLLCTDGVYDKLCSRPLRRYWGGLDTVLAGYFLSPWTFDWLGEPPETICADMAAAFRDAQPNDFYPRVARMVAQGGDGEAATQFVIGRVLQKNRPLNTLKGIQDDVTAAVLVNAAARPDSTPAEYYRPPDWDEINRRIYLELYGDPRGTNEG